MEFFIYLAIGIAAIAIVWMLLKKSSTKENGGKISSKYATLSDVETYLRGFVPVLDEKLKDGYTEKSVENQMAKYLKQRFVEVKQQYGIEGVTARSIDIDVANGVAGIELKDAKKVVKAAERDRAIRQLQVYQEKRYQDNLILAVVGSEEYENDACIIEIREYCKKNSVKYYFFTLK